MGNKVNKYVKDAFTERDGESICPVRTLFIVGAVLYLYFSLREIAITDVSFFAHAKEWIEGFGQYIGLSGGAVAVKNYTEKTNDNT